MIVWDFFHQNPTLMLPSAQPCWLDGWEIRCRDRKPRSKGFPRSVCTEAVDWNYMITPSFMHCIAPKNLSIFQSECRSKCRRFVWVSKKNLTIDLGFGPWILPNVSQNCTEYFPIDFPRWLIGNLVFPSPPSFLYIRTFTTTIMLLFPTLWNQMVGIFGVLKQIKTLKTSSL